MLETCIALELLCNKNNQIKTTKPQETKRAAQRLKVQTVKVANQKDKQTKLKAILNTPIPLLPPWECTIYGLSPFLSCIPHRKLCQQVERDSTLLFLS